MSEAAKQALTFDRSGLVVGNWRLVRPIGTGAFGMVYEAQHTAIGRRRAAAKVLHPHLTQNPEMTRRFLNDANASSSVQNDHVVQVFDGGLTDQGVCYLVMELLEGETLKGRLLRGGPLDVALSLHVARQVAEALALVHKVPIVHRDLKPDNIMLVPRPGDPSFVKVLDFGVAKLRPADDGQGASITSSLLGTPAYMAPEQWHVLPDLDGRADIYALGMILYRCLTGAAPFNASTLPEWMAAHLERQPPDPGTIVPLPPGLSALVQRMMAKDRGARPQTMDEVAAALLAIEQDLREVSLSFAEISISPAAPPASPASPAASAFGEHTSTLGRLIGERTTLDPGTSPRRRWPIVAAGLALGFALPVGVTTWRGRRAEEPAGPRPTLGAAVTSPPLAGLVSFPGGTFQQGMGGPRDKDGPAHPVQVGPFALALRETTMGEYREYAERRGVTGPLPWEGAADFARVRDLPVNQVTRAQAAAYCRWRYASCGGRLPSESEWEYAARDGDAGHRYPFPGAPDAGKANLRGETRSLIEVGSLPRGRSERGLFDLIGNVAEWTADDALPYPAGPKVPAGVGVVRGGGADTSPHEVSATTRVFVDPARQDPFIGFRCACDMRGS